MTLEINFVFKNIFKLESCTCFKRRGAKKKQRQVDILFMRRDLEGISTLFLHEYSPIIFIAANCVLRFHDLIDSRSVRSLPSQSRFLSSQAEKKRKSLHILRLGAQNIVIRMWLKLLPKLPREISLRKLFLFFKFVPRQELLCALELTTNKVF